MTSLTQHSGFASGRMMLLFGIFGAHALLIWAISSGLARPVISFPDAIDAVFLPADPAAEPLPPPPPPPVRDQPVAEDFVLPDYDFAVANDVGSTAILVPQAQPDPGPVAARQPKIVPLQYTSQRSPNEFYPPMAQRLGEQGVTEIEACVGTNGRLEAVPTVRSSSGYPRLDEAAVLYAQQALRFKPATSDGTPLRSCKGFRVNFQLH